MITKADFVAQMGDLLHAAKPNLVKCELFTGGTVPLSDIEIAHGVRYDPHAAVVLVTCENGYTYKVDVTADSLGAIVLDVFKAMVYK